MTKNSVRPRKLGCRLKLISFPDSETVILHLPAGHCTDMNGAIRFAMKLVQEFEGFNLRFVATFSGDKPDTVYVLLSDGTWKARDARTNRTRASGGP